jgi:ABC-type polysaccharide/polyol phosphate transport system ATPase subunit
MYGLGKKDVDLIIDEIIEFSELGEFIDTPVRTYSSGMYMRLAFSIAVNVQAEILLIDEILAVGDSHFQDKCLNKMKELKAQGKTMVFVSHSAPTVKSFCDRAIWLYDGEIRMDGNVDEVINEYEKVEG